MHVALGFLLFGATPSFGFSLRTAAEQLAAHKRKHNNKLSKAGSDSASDSADENEESPPQVSVEARTAHVHVHKCACGCMQMDTCAVEDMQDAITI